MRRLPRRSARACITFLLLLTAARVEAQAPVFLTAWGTFGTAPGEFNTVVGVAVDGNGNVYACDQNNHRIQKFSNTGSFVTQWGSFGSGDGQFNAPAGLCVDPSGIIYVADTGNHRIQKFTSSGAYVGQWGTQGREEGQIDVARGVAADAAGNVYVAEHGWRVQKFTSDGAYLTHWRDPSSAYDPDGIAVDSNGDVYVVDLSRKRVQKFTGDGVLLTQWGMQGGGPGQFQYPVRVAVDDDFVYVVDNGISVISIFTKEGSSITQWGTFGSGPGQFLNPIGIAVDGSRNIFVCDTNNSRIQKFGYTPTAVSSLSWGAMKVRFRKVTDRP